MGTKKDQKEIKGITKPLIANLDITQKEAISYLPYYSTTQHAAHEYVQNYVNLIKVSIVSISGEILLI